jgi:probable F420-dependent oxidoreductase
MKIGVNLLNWGPGVSPDALARTTALIEALGYHLVMISDHVAPTPDVAIKYPTPLYDPFTTLGWLASATRRIELGTTVIILPYRNPILTARMAATVDQLCGGRFIFGVGVGWAKQEFEALGVPFTRRGAISNDYLEAIKTLWTRDVASYAGAFVSFKDVHTAPRPLRSPHPPIWIGGSTDAALRGRALRRRLASEPRTHGLAPRRRPAEAQGGRRRRGQAGAGALPAHQAGDHGLTARRRSAPDRSGHARSDAERPGGARIARRRVRAAGQRGR